MRWTAKSGKDVLVRGRIKSDSSLCIRRGGLLTAHLRMLLSPSGKKKPEITSSLTGKLPAEQNIRPDRYVSLNWMSGEPAVIKSLVSLRHALPTHAQSTL